MDNTINSLIGKSIGLTPEQLRQVAANPNQAMNIGGIYYQPQYDSQGSGQDYQQGPLTGYLSYAEKDNKAGGAYNQYDAEGNLIGTGTQQKVSNNMLPFLLAAGGMAFGGPLLEALGGGSSLGSLGAVGSDLAGLSGIPAGAGALNAAETAALYGGGASTLADVGAIGSDLAGLSGIPAGTEALTAAEAAALGGAALPSATLPSVVGSDLAGLSGIPAGTGALTAAEAAALAGGGAAALPAALPSATLPSVVGSDLAGLSGIPAGTGALTAAEAAALGGGGLGAVSGMGTGLTANAAGLGVNPATASLGTQGLGAGIGAGAGGLAAANSLLGGSTLGSSLGSLATGVGAGALGSTLGGLGGSAIGSGLGSTLSGLDTGVGSALGPAAGSAAGSGLGSLFGGGLGTALGVSSLGSLLSGVLGANAATSAADKQAAAAQYAADLQKKMFDTLNTQQAPYRAGGYNALNQIQGMLPGQYTQYDASGNPIGTATGTDYFTHQFNNQDFQNNIDPGYAWRLQQGQMANQRLANKGGGLLGANAQQGMQDYTQGLASQEYQNAYNRYTGNQTNIYNRLASLAGIGQAGQTQTNTAAQNAATNMGNLAVGSAGAQAAGGIGAANAYGNTLGNIGNNFMLSQLLNQKQNIG